MKRRIWQGSHRVASLGAAVAVVTFASAAGAATSSASVLGWGLPTQTVLVASTPSLSAPGSVTITATIRPGLLVTPFGSVTFTDTTNQTALGSAKPATRCLLSFQPCVVTITVAASSLQAGPNTISGTYSGDIIEARSTGTVSVTLDGQITSSQDVTTTYCSGACDTGSQTSPDGSTSLSITANAGQSGSITDSFSTTPLACSTTGAGFIGDTAVFSATGLTGNKTIDYSVSGSAADDLNALYFGGEHVCYDSPVRFTTAAGTPATPDGSGGYYGLLPQCNLPASSGDDEGGFDGDATNPPCVDYSYFFNSEGEGPDVYNEQFETTASDPRASN